MGGRRLLSRIWVYFTDTSKTMDFNSMDFDSLVSILESPSHEGFSRAWDYLLPRRDIWTKLATLGPERCNGLLLLLLKGLGAHTGEQLVARKFFFLNFPLQFYMQVLGQEAGLANAERAEDQEVEKLSGQKRKAKRLCQHQGGTCQTPICGAT